MLVEVREIKQRPDLFPDLYDNLYKALKEIEGNCNVKLVRL